MAHEKSVTIKLDTGFWANAPSIYNGKSYTEDQVRNKLIKGEVKPTSIHKNHIDAKNAARERSASYKKKNYSNEHPKYKNK